MCCICVLVLLFKPCSLTTKHAIGPAKSVISTEVVSEGKTAVRNAHIVNFNVLFLNWSCYLLLVKLKVLNIVNIFGCVHFTLLYLILIPELIQTSSSFDHIYEVHYYDIRHACSFSFLY